jgi:hypothetical protein
LTAAAAAADDDDDNVYINMTWESIRQNIPLSATMSVGYY